MLINRLSAQRPTERLVGDRLATKCASSVLKAFRPAGPDFTHATELERLTVMIDVKDLLL